MKKGSSTKTTKHAGGCPSKLTPKFLQVAKQVIEDDELNACICTDEELLFMINANLEGKEKIGEVTLRNWKQGKFGAKGELGQQFLSLYKKALINQRRRLFDLMLQDEKAWQKYAWIIERKFDEWNIRKKIETDLTSKGEKIGISFLGELDGRTKGVE